PTKRRAPECRTGWTRERSARAVRARFSPVHPVGLEAVTDAPYRDDVGAPFGSQLLANAGDVAVHRARVALLEGGERELGQLSARNGAALAFDQVNEHVELVARE